MLCEISCADEGFALFAFNKGEVCTCPSRALIQESIFEKFMDRAITRIARIKVGDPLDPATQMGAQASEDQLTKILGYIEIGKQEGAKCLTGGERAHLRGDLERDRAISGLCHAPQSLVDRGAMDRWRWSDDANSEV
jgi:acyl-CoA reductase-like NAD-dependent aldehyde dehydrogenase